MNAEHSANFHHSTTVHTDMSWAFLLIVGLLLVALVIVARVLIASRHSLAIWPKMKSALAVLVWVVPAVAVVGFIGQQRFEHIQSAEPRVSLQRSGRSTETRGAVERRGARAKLASAEREQELSQAVPAEAAASEGHVLPPRLTVRRVSSEDPKLALPDAQSHDPHQFCLSSERFATLAEAEAHVTELALARVRELSAVEFPDIHDWLARHPVSNLRFLIDLMNQYGVKELVGEVMDWDFKNGTTGKMYRAHLRFDFSPGLRDALERRWQGETAEHRLILLGSLLGLVTLMLGTAAGYFRLDDATGGAYRGRLKLAALAVVAAGSVAAVGVIGP